MYLVKRIGHKQDKVNFLWITTVLNSEVPSPRLLAKEPSLPFYSPGVSERRDRFIVFSLSIIGGGGKTLTALLWNVNYQYY